MLFVAGIAYAAHGHWIDHFRQANGQGCCYRGKDCRPVKARILERGHPETAVEVNGIRYRMPTGSIHASEDDDDWFCSVKYPPPYDRKEWEEPLCLFIAPKT